MIDNIDDAKIVTLTGPIEHKGFTHIDSETWLSLLEKFLMINYKNYKITTTRDFYEKIAFVKIEFESIEDATWFKLVKH